MANLLQIKLYENKFGKLSVKFPKGMVTGDPPKAGACFSRTNSCSTWC